ncbi:transmembrane emp24 domain-containing protein 1-like [Homarus americanus]|uniref:Transmembrane emp24 domain-containing protein 1-like n=1 Tax=Homarus americanus TaxID=6706 RepID=A0A8J5JY16_HOMAM|nr:transmembrane emp24 domain-containing protein 1-like [Homarus americanus]KAG7163213.1 Transmembrane emp24 domain-containing protein 1-like [Homarus americanus]
MASHSQIYLVLLTMFLVHTSYSREIEREMTVEVKAGTEECFYEMVKAGETLDVEYQVIDGGQGELDINFYVAGPLGTVLVQDLRRGEGSHRTTMSEQGDYRICWDNTFSHFNTKTVFFGVMIENENDDDDDDLWDSGFEASVTAEDIYEMKIEDIKGAMDRIRGHLTKSRFMQDQLRAYEARDRNVAENNCSKVNTWSIVNVVIMLVTGIIQVVLLKSLFDDKSRLHGIWKKGAASTFS